MFRAVGVQSLAITHRIPSVWMRTAYEGHLETLLPSPTATDPAVSDDGRSVLHWRASLIAQRCNLLGPTSWQRLGTLMLNEAASPSSRTTHPGRQPLSAAVDI
jgi:hypothetical protein